MSKLEGKITVVIGGSSGIGLATEIACNLCASFLSRNQSRSASPDQRDDLVQRPRNFGNAREKQRQEA
jgi:NAD(P)-dependent dehydrogenase (short-subunit alcohol dehydrogenase family)